MLCESAIYFLLPVICGVAIAISYQCLRQHTISETRIQQGLQAILCGRYGFRQRRLQVADVNARVRHSLGNGHLRQFQEGVLSTCRDRHGVIPVHTMATSFTRLHLIGSVRA
jgi:hypothetical protein